MAVLDNETVSGSGSTSGPTDCRSYMPPTNWRQTPNFLPGSVVGSGTIGLGGSVTGTWIWVVTDVCPVFGTVDVVVVSPPPPAPSPPV